MKKYIAILFFLLPLAAQAQLDVPGFTNSAGTVVPTTHFTGREEYIFVFYDSIPHALSLQATDSICAAQPCSTPSTFTWKKLNVADTTLDIVHEESPTSAVSELSAASLTEGGYQVTIERAGRCILIVGIATCRCRSIQRCSKRHHSAVFDRI